MARKLKDHDRKVFKEHCDQALASSLETTYLHVNTNKNLEALIEANSEHQFLNLWIKLWDSLRELIFSAFAPNAPKMNLADIIDAGWSNSDSPNLSLLNAAQINVKVSILLAAELRAIEKGSSIAFEQGPSFQQKKARSHHQEIVRAVQF